MKRFGAVKQIVVNVVAVDVSDDNNKVDGGEEDKEHQLVGLGAGGSAYVSIRSWITVFPLDLKFEK
uniref:Uncharacterized protein n=1 Tax=Setaria digitata TaxID=48799 RepID=A0A915PVK8_9BILA